jgi:Protein of unknown function (DUF2442)
MAKADTAPKKRRLTDAEIRRQIPAARARARRAAKVEPRARAAHYEVATGRVVVELTNGGLFAFPAELGPGLAGATDEDLAGVELDPGGGGLRWEALDADISVPGMLEQLFGVRTAMSALGARGGRSTSDAKMAAARRNGAKGGRPRKRAAG